MNSKKTIKHKRRNKKKSIRRYKRIYKRGGDPLSPEQKEDAKAYIKIINNYVDKQNAKGVEMNIESVKYTMFKEKLAEVKVIESKGDDITLEDLKKLESFVYFIIKDEVSEYGLLFDENAAGFQIWINNLLMYLVNDQPFEDEILVKLIAGIDKKPYIKVDHKKKYNNFIFDVNELLANIKNELSGKTNPKDKIIKETTMKIRGEIGPVPE
jgi:uncharacterized protein YnzC (UPF0291/DUF896 family)